MVPSSAKKGRRLVPAFALWNQAHRGGNHFPPENVYKAAYANITITGGGKFETTHEVAAKERHRKKPSKRDGEKRREEKLRGRKRVVSENKAATAQKGKALRHGKGFRGR